MAKRQDPYEELCGYWHCAKCKRKHEKHGKCCGQPIEFKDGTFLCYFTGDYLGDEIHPWAKKWVDLNPGYRWGWIEHKKTTVQIVHKPEMDWKVLQLWVEEYVHVSSLS